MNNKQKIVIKVGIGIIFLMGIFPPWTYTYKAKSISSEKPAGYALLFSPPSPTGYYSYAHGVKLDFTKLLLQWFLVSIVTTGVVISLRKDRPKIKQAVKFEKEDPEQLKKSNEDLAYFIGKNSDRYLPRFKKLDTGDLSVSTFWHWPAFFLGFWWFLYRKLYLWAGIWILVATFAIFISPFVGLLSMVIWGISGNYIYYRQAKKRVHELKTKKGSISESDFSVLLRRTGGVNKWVTPVAITICAIFFLGIVAAILIPQLATEKRPSIPQEARTLFDQWDEEAGLKEGPPISQEATKLFDKWEVVRDMKTGLEWVVGPDRDMTWNEAKSWAESLSIDGGGWRMPTVKELKALYKKGTGERNMTPLLKTTGWGVWSGEKEGSSSAWLFYFGYGRDYWEDRNYSNLLRAFAVRSRGDG